MHISLTQQVELTKELYHTAPLADTNSEQNSLFGKKLYQIDLLPQNVNCPSQSPVSHLMMDLHSSLDHLPSL